MKIHYFTIAWAVAIMVSVSQPSVASPTYEEMQTFHEIQRLKHVAGREREARELARTLLAKMGKSSELKPELHMLLHELEKGNPQFDLEKAVKYATGTKQEIYCKGVGLVEMTGRHNDGSTSHVVLTKWTRAFHPSGDYSQMKSGTWVYEMSNTHRKATSSDLWITSETTTNWKVSELRENTDGRADRGTWICSLEGTRNSTCSLSTNGQVKEPLPMFMALDYHLWGNRDLGYRIQFEPGFTDVHDAREVGAKKDILLKAVRTVGTAIPVHGYKDSAGKSYEHKDCYPVDYKITLDGTEAPKN